MAADFIYRELSDPTKVIKLRDLYKICDSPDLLRNWLFKEGLLGDYHGPCDICSEGIVSLVKDTSKCDGYVWRCSKQKCRAKKSIRYGSWFAGSHLSLDTIILLTYFWVYSFPQDIIQRELDIKSCHTTVDWCNFCREICENILLSDNKKIGGPGFTVEIDELDLLLKINYTDHSPTT